MDSGKGTSDSRNNSSQCYIWISIEVFDWIPFVEGRECLENGTELNRSYDVWHYANELVCTPRSPEDHATAIIHFKRAIEFRDQLLDSIYDFESIPGAVAIKRRITNRREAKQEIMSALELMRPAMKESLRKLRNGLIHDARFVSPTTDLCRTLSDFTWYYLRSTDFIGAQPVSDIIFSQEPPPYGSFYPLVHLELHLRRSPWRLEINGTLPSDLVSMHERHGFFRVQAKTTKHDAEKIHIDGIICGPEEAELAIMRRSFAVI